MPAHWHTFTTRTAMIHMAPLVTKLKPYVASDTRMLIAVSFQEFILYQRKRCLSKMSYQKKIL